MKIVTFELADEQYGIPVEYIHEIIMDQEITRVPNLPSFLKGITHLREAVIPIVDGMERLGYEDSGQVDSSRVLIVEYDDQLIGIRVTSADDVLEVDEDTIQSSPNLISEMGGEFVSGVIEISDEPSGGREEFERAGSRPSSTGSSSSQDSESSKSILLLDLERLFTGEEIDKIREARREHGGDS